jgi:hypothetical protein
MSSQTKTTEYGGIQVDMVNGLKNGEGIARIGMFDIAAGETIAKEAACRSNLGRDLENPTVPASLQFVIVTRQTNYGFAGRPEGPGAATPEAKIIAEKVITPVQRATGAAPSSKASDAKLIAEKFVGEVQRPVDGGTARPNL